MDNPPAIHSSVFMTANLPSSADRSYRERWRWSKDDCREGIGEELSRCALITPERSHRHSLPHHGYERDDHSVLQPPCRQFPAQWVLHGKLGAIRAR